MALFLLIQFSMIMTHNLDVTDSRKIEFVIEISYRLNQINQTIIAIDIWNNCDTCTITRIINVYCILDVTTSAINILIKTAILVSALVVLTIIFDKITSNLDEISESECDYDLNSNVCKKMQSLRVALLILHKL